MLTGSASAQANAPAPADRPQGNPPPSASGTQTKPPQAGSTKAAPQKNEQAMTALKQMSDTIASAKTLRFKTRALRPFKTADGEWVTLVTTSTVMRDGNDKLHFEAGGDAFRFDLFFDGKTITAYAPEKKVFAQKEAAGTIDQALDRAAQNGEVTIMFADLLKSDPYASITKGMQSAKVVGTSTVGGAEVQHLAAHGAKMDWEIWIGAEDHLPRLLTLTDTTEARKPTYAVEFSEWALDQPLPSALFSFNAPQDATRIPFHGTGKGMAAGRAPPRPGH